MTVREWKKLAWQRLNACGDLDAETDSSLFLCAVLETERSALRFREQEELSAAELKRLDEMLRRRENGEPEQYIEGTAWFMGLPFFADQRALIPRFDTEILCEAAIGELKQREHSRVLDICTGSGCIAVSVAKYCPRASVTGADISPEALEQARQNAARNSVKVEWIQSDGFTTLGNRSFDAVLCNPPYLTKEDLAFLQKEVAYEPLLALYGGPDGLDFYRRFAEEMKNYLAPSAFVLFEVGEGQADEVSRLLSSVYPASQIDTVKDFSGIQRTVRMRLS